MSIDEVEKIIKFLRQMEIIARTSSNPTQVERVKKDIVRYRARLRELVPDYRPEKETIDQLAERVLRNDVTEPADSVAGPRANSSATDGPLTPADRIPDIKASPHCSDPDVNFMAAVLTIILKEYWPGLTEQHVRMDFTSSQERHGLRFKLDNAVRSLKTLTETIEEYAVAEKPDFREQLFKMKNKQSRLFLFECNDIFREFKTYMARLMEDMQQGGLVIKNPQDLVRFDRNYEDATWFENFTVRDLIFEFYNLLDYSIKKINLPSMK